jgi:hypothetical protein
LYCSLNILRTERGGEENNKKNIKRIWIWHAASVLYGNRSGTAGETRRQKEKAKAKKSTTVWGEHVY